MIRNLSRSCLVVIALGGVATLGTGGCGGDDDASASFPLREGTQVVMRLTGLQAPEGVSVTYRLGESLLTEPGDTGVIGVAIEDLHVHGEWSVTVPADVEPDDLTLGVSFVLDSPSSGYQESAEIMAYLELHHDDDHEGEDGHDHEGEDDDDHDGEDDHAGEDDHEHGDMIIASTGADGGRLLLDYDFAEQPVELDFNQCIGGSGDDCDGGLLLYTTADPGFAPLE